MTKQEMLKEIESLERKIWYLEGADILTFEQQMERQECALKVFSLKAELTKMN